MNNWELYANRETSLQETSIKPGTQQAFEFSFAVPENDQVKTASKEIDSILPFSAWPLGELSEIRAKTSEDIFHLLLPLLSKLNSEKRWITLIAPPAEIDKKLFAYHGIDVSRVLLIHPRDAVDDTVTMNKALKNGNSGIVIYWTEKFAMRFAAQWRKSVKQGNCRGIIINHDRNARSSSSIALTLNVKTSDAAITITSSKSFGEKTHYRAKRSFPIVRLADASPEQSLSSFGLVN